jgi:hypothetical protein
MIIMLLGVFLIIALLEVPGLVKKQYWRELIVFGFFLSIGLILSMLLTLGVKFPYITTVLNGFIKHLFNL